MIRDRTCFACSANDLPCQLRTVPHPHADSQTEVFEDGVYNGSIVAE